MRLESVKRDKQRDGRAEFPGTPARGEHTVTRRRSRHQNTVEENYPASEAEAVEHLQQADGQFRADHMLQIDLVALEHGVRVLGAPPDVNPVDRGENKRLRSLIRRPEAVAPYRMHQSGGTGNCIKWSATSVQLLSERIGRGRFLCARPNDRKWNEIPLTRRFRIT